MTETDVSTPQEPEKWTDPASLLSKEKFDELRQKLADIPDSEFDDGLMSDERFQATEQACHGSHFTREQITDYCEKVLDKCLFISLDEAVKLLTDGVQIIRQLQAEAGMLSLLARIGQND